MIAPRTVNGILFAPIRRTAVAIGMLLVMAMAPVSAKALDLLIGTGEVGTFSHFSGRVVARIVQKHLPAVKMQVVPGEGAVHNLTNLAQGSLDLALVDARMLQNAMAKKGRFEFLGIRYDTVRGLIPLYDVPLTVIVRRDAGIETLGQLAGKRINAGPSRSDQRMAADAVMAAKNWKKTDFSVYGEISDSLSQQSMAFCHGTVQALFHAGVHPDPRVRQLIERCDAAIVAANDAQVRTMINADKALKLTVIAADTYPGQSQRIDTMGTQVILVATEDLDRETVAAVIEALYSNPRRLHDAHAALALTPMDPGDASLAGAPLHPGIEDYRARH